MFIRALMTSVCHSAIVCEWGWRWGEAGAAMGGGSLCPSLTPSYPAVENPYRVDATVIRNRAKLLQKYMRDEQKELQALYALQALVVKLEQPPSEWQGGAAGPGRGRRPRPCHYGVVAGEWHGSFYPPPPDLLRMFFDALYDEDVIKEEAFYKWESSKDLSEQQGKGVALKSVTAFFTWLREAEDESDNN